MTVITGTTLRGRIALMTGAAALALCPVPALAQSQSQQNVAPSADTPAPSDEPAGEVVVTGTLIRGVAPVGTQVITVSPAQIQAVSSPAAKDLLAEIPQVSSFFNQIPATGSDFGSVNTSPALRSIGYGTTLFLIDGHRVAPYGAISDAPDADVIPTFALQRVEIVPDGGSSIYGSDGVAGVINYITKRKFDGVEFEGRYGFADNYKTWDVNGAVGRSWGDFSSYVAFSHSQHDAIFNRDRSYARAYSTSLVRTCNPGNVSVGGSFYSLTDFTPGGSLCDGGLDSSLYPRENRNSVFAGASYDSSGFSADVRGYYTNRKANAFTGALADSGGLITSANPFFRSIAGETSQTVIFNFAPVFGPSSKTHANIHEYGIAPSATIGLGSEWKLRLSGYAGHSDTTNHNPQLNGDALGAALAATDPAAALDPYDLTKTNSAVLAAIGNYEQYAHSDENTSTARAVVDGSLFTLPGGNVSLAAGAEYIHQDFDATAGNIVTGHSSDPSLGHGHASRNVGALFGEVVVPVFSADNAVAGIQQLTLSASARYDHYNTFGGVFNPKFSVTYKPVSSLKIRANYAKAFNAPQLSDLGAADTRSFVTSAAGFGVLYPGDSTSNSSRPLIVLAGGSPDLKPQRARIWTVGADFTPSALPGLTLSGTYYNVNISNVITIMFPGQDPNYYADYGDRLVLRNPTLAQAQAFTAGIPVSGYNLTDLYNSGNAPYAAVDFRRHNFGNIRQRGLDLSAIYDHTTDFGSLYASVAGTYILKKTQQVAPGLPYADILEPNNSRFNLAAALGATVSAVTARVTMLHTQGYSVNNLINQTHVSSFNTFNAFFSYALNGSGILKDTALTLNVDNVFNTRPPRANNSTGYINGGTLGRLIEFGLRKKF